MSSSAPASSGAVRRGPRDFLRQVLGRQVVVRLNNGTDYRGILACLDEKMNIVMEQSEECCGDVTVSRYGDAFIRGNNGKYFGIRSRQICLRSFIHKCVDAGLKIVEGYSF
eukprot:Selendium_serpulae@DN2970_c0_g1_i2.p2